MSAGTDAGAGVGGIGGSRGPRSWQPTEVIPDGNGEVGDLTVDFHGQWTVHFSSHLHGINREGGVVRTHPAFYGGEYGRIGR